MRAGSDGLDIVRRILSEARAHLTPDGALVCEVGTGRALLESEFPDLPLIWLDTERRSQGEVFFVRADDLAPRRKGKTRRLKPNVVISRA